MPDRSLKVQRVNALQIYIKEVNFHLFAHVFLLLSFLATIHPNVIRESGQRGHCQGSSGGMRQVLLGTSMIQRGQTILYNAYTSYIEHININ